MNKISSILKFMFFFAMAFAFWGCSQSCDVKLKNGTAGDIKILTKVSGKENSTTLKSGETLIVGKCTDCSELNDDEIEVDQMLVSLGVEELELKDKKEVIKFLSELKSEDCVVKIFQ